MKAIKKKKRDILFDSLIILIGFSCIANLAILTYFEDRKKND